MNKLLEAAKAVLNQYSKSRSYLSADIDSDVIETLRQAVQEAEMRLAIKSMAAEVLLYGLDRENARDSAILADQEQCQSDPPGQT